MSLQTLTSTEYNFPGLQSVYKGKVRDVYRFPDHLVMVVTDRISAFDVVLPKSIPDKGRILNLLAARNLEATRDIVPNWLLSVPDPNVSVGLACEPLKIEMVVRGYLAGHAWRTYASGERMLCGAMLPEGLKENDKFDTPIITPSTKADEGHDEDVAPEDILARKLATPEEWELLCQYALQLFERGTQLAEKQGLILVDTKYEFGKYKNQIILIDEVHTPDSSRYFYAEGYAQRQARAEKQKQLSKEFVREWLMENGFSGKEGQSIPAMTDEVVDHISQRYRVLYHQLTGEALPSLSGDETILERVHANILNALSKF